VEKTASFYIISSCNYFYGVHPQREMTFAAVYFSSFVLDTLHILGTSGGEHCCSRPMLQDG